MTLHHKLWQNFICLIAGTFCILLLLINVNLNSRTHCDLTSTSESSTFRPLIHIFSHTNADASANEALVTKSSDESPASEGLLKGFGSRNRTRTRTRSSSRGRTRELNFRADGVSWQDIRSELHLKFDDNLQWPQGGIDILIRTHKADLSTLQTVLVSIERFWPYHLGRCIIVADSGLHEVDIGLLLPDWCELVHEKRSPFNMKGYWMQQWSNMWADNYTSSEYVAFFDSDSVLHTLVTPDMIFDEERRVVHTTSDFQYYEYLRGSNFWLGNISMRSHPNHSSYESLKETEGTVRWPDNFMLRLPLVFPAKMFPAFRNYIIGSGVHTRMEKNPETGKWKHGIPYSYFDLFVFDYVTQWWPFTQAPSQFNFFGNYLRFHSPPELQKTISVIYQTSPNTLPLGRPGAHVPYSRPYNASRQVGESKVLISRYADHSFDYMTNGECMLFAPKYLYPNDSSYNYSQECLNVWIPANASRSNSSSNLNSTFTQSLSQDIGVPHQQQYWMDWYMPGCEGRWPNVPTDFEQLGRSSSFSVTFYYNHESWAMVERDRLRVVKNAFIHRQKWLQQLTSRVRVPREPAALQIVKSCIWQSSDPEDLTDFIAKYPRPELWIDQQNPWQKR